MRYLLIRFIHVYRCLLSPFLGGHCRFYPSCSQYALEAIETHGSGYGSWIAFRRLTRCHPWHPGGYDPIPGVSDEASHG